MRWDDGLAVCAGEEGMAEGKACVLCFFCGRMQTHGIVCLYGPVLSWSGEWHMP